MVEETVEKKLTDEEWFEEYAKACKALEDGYCEQLAYGGTGDAQTEKEIEVDRRLIAYVHRLQAENTELREDVERWEAVYKICEERKYRKMFNEEWKKEYQKELDKEGEGLIAGSPDFDYVYELYFKQKAEIERLKDEFKTDYRNSWKNKFFSALEENRELQKQVDEYFKKAYFYYQKCKAYGIENFYDEELEPKPAKEGKTIAFPKFKGDDEVE